MRVLLAAAAVLVACGPDDRDPAQPDATPSQPDAPPTVTDSPPLTDTSKVYAHSGANGPTPGKLFRVNNQTLTPVEIGSIGGLPAGEGLLDLAVDKNDLMVGVTRTKLFAISATTGAATLIRDLGAQAQGLTSLSFVPDSTGADILVSADSEGDVLQIDQATGQATRLGNYGTFASAQITSSGDLFGVAGVGIYATVRIGGDATANDYLAKIDPANGWKAMPLQNDTGYKKIFGLGYWGGRIYGFVDQGFEAGMGTMIEIDAMTGSATELNISSNRWFGAAVATDAPIVL